MNCAGDLADLTPEQVAKLDAASAAPPAYPSWHQRGSAERNRSDLVGKWPPWVRGP